MPHRTCRERPLQPPQSLLPFLLSCPSLFLLIHHFDGARPALMGADPAPLAVIQVRLKKSVRILGHAPLGTVYIADAAFDAFCIIPDRAPGPPAAGVICGGAARP